MLQQVDNSYHTTLGVSRVGGNFCLTFFVDCTIFTLPHAAVTQQCSIDLSLHL